MTAVQYTRHGHFHPSVPLADRVAALSRPQPNGCIEWGGTVDTKGYGCLSFANKKHRAHRVSYELTVGPIPDGLQLDHLCRNRRCINPQHLEPVTNRENHLRSPVSASGRNAAKSTCSTCGSEYDTVTSNGTRACRPCRTAYMKAWHARRPGLNAERCRARRAALKAKAAAV